MSLSAVIVSTGGSLVQSNSDAGSLAPLRAGGTRPASPRSSSVCAVSSGTPDAAAGFVASASSAGLTFAARPAGDEVFGLTHLVLAASVRAARALPDPRGRVGVCGTPARHDVQPRRRRWLRVPSPASARRRQGRCPLRSRPRPRPDRRLTAKTSYGGSTPVCRSATQSIGRARTEIVAVIGGLRAVQLDLGSAGIKGDAIGFLGQHGPGGSVWQARQCSHRFPREIDPRAVRLAARNDDPDRNPGKSRRNVHSTASKWAIGRPVTRFCGFMRSIRSGVIANIR